MSDNKYHRRSSPYASAMRKFSRWTRSPNDTTGSENDDESSFSSFTSTPPTSSVSHKEDMLRRRSPLSPIENKMSATTKETPRMWKEQNTVQENVARRKKRRSVSFSPQPPHVHQPLSYFTIQGQLSNDDDIESFNKDDTSKEQESPEEPKREFVEKAVQDRLQDHDWYNAPTRLHDVCYRATSPSDLHQVKSWFQQATFSRGRELITAARRKDTFGRNPLHVLSENTTLSQALYSQDNATTDDSSIPELQPSSSFGHETIDGENSVAFFVLDVLLPANPSGMARRDNDGYLPFERAIFDWVEEVHESWLTENSSKAKRSSILMRRPALESVATERIQNVIMSTSASVSTAINWAGRSLYFNRSLTSLEESDLKKAEDIEEGPLPSSSLEKGAVVNTSTTTVGKRLPEAQRHRVFPLNGRLTPHFQFSLKLLSAILDQIDKNDASRSFQRKPAQNNDDRCDGALRESTDTGDLRDCFQENHSAPISNAVIESLASIPNLVKAILLLKDNSERSWVFSCSVVRKLLMSEHSIGPWLTAMLQSPNKKVSERAVEYLRIVSDVCEEGKALWKSSSNHQQLYKEISMLDGLIPSMLSLDEKSIEDAATTPIIKEVLDKMIARSFAVTVVFFDALFLLVLIVSFRASVVGFLTGEAPGKVLKWIYVANAGIFYFIIRELGKAISLCMITKRARTYFLSFWNVLDVLAIILALSSTIAMRVNFSHEDLDLDDLRQLRGCLAVTTGLLWLRVLSLLKTINMQLATFVLAIVQITRDILWFLLILLTLIVACSQMFYTLLIPSTCASDDDDVRECRPSEYYLSVYTILLGDFGMFEREDFKTKFSVLLVVAYSFMVVIVLLNVLIAIVSDSYEKCLIRSQNLFGRARVMLLAELVSFQNLLRINTESYQGDQKVQSPIYNQWWSGQLWNKGWTRSSALFFSLSALVVLVWIIGETAGHFAGERYGSFLFSICSILFNTLLFVAIVTFLSRSAPGETGLESSSRGDRSETNRFVRLVSNWYERFIQKAMHRILGSTKDSSLSSMGGKHGEVAEWRGRVNHLQREMSRIAQESNDNVAELTKDLEQHVTGSESRIRGEMCALESQMESFKSDLINHLKESEQRTDDLIRNNMNELLRTLTTSRSIR